MEEEEEEEEEEEAEEEEMEEEEEEAEEEEEEEEEEEAEEGEEEEEEVAEEMRPPCLSGGVDSHVGRQHGGVNRVKVLPHRADGFRRILHCRAHGSERLRRLYPGSYTRPLLCLT